MSNDNGPLVPLEAAGYASESDFQHLLAANPGVLASALDVNGDVRRWLLVDRELDIRSSEEGDSVRWSLDHLFIDADGVPTLVEVKRSSDPRARREVVAQMLDYAASFSIDWSADRLRGRWEHRLATAGIDRDSEMDAFLETTSFEDEGQLWSEVQTKISASRLRLLFVADRLSATLVRIIEYLNVQLKDTEVLGVEVVRHASGTVGLVAYEPVVRGRTAAVSRTKSGGGERRSRDEFDAVLRTNHGEDVLGATTDLIAKAERLGAFVSIGTGAKSPTLFLNLRTTSTGRALWPMGVNPRAGKLVLFLRYLKNHPAYEDEAVRAELVDRVAAATGASVNGADRLEGVPWVPIASLMEPGVVDRVIGVLEWVVATANRSGGPDPVES